MTGPCDCGAEDCPRCFPGCLDTVNLACKCGGQLPAYRAGFCIVCDAAVCEDCEMCAECEQEAEQETEQGASM